MKEEEFMRSALDDAQKNGHRFGAVIVKDGKIIAKAGKRPKGDARFHAETQAIFHANKKFGKDLKGCILYSTCEPCPMCFYMAWITGISKIIYGATTKDSMNVGIPEIDITITELNKRSGNAIFTEGGLLREDCIKLLKETYKPS